MNLLLVSSIFFVVTILFATSPPSLKKKKPRHRKNRLRDKEAPAEVRLLPELFPLIFRPIFDTLKLKRTFADPLKQYRLVSKYWHDCLSGDMMRHVIMAHPRTAALLVKRTFRTDGPFYSSLLITGKQHLQATACARKLLVNAKDTSVFKIFSELSGLCEVGLSNHAFEKLLVEACANKSLTAPLIGDEMFHEINHSVLFEHLMHTLHSQYSLHLIPPHQILLLCFLEDMSSPIQYGKVLTFVVRQTMHAYRCAKGEGLKSLLSALNQTVLPRSQSNALFAIFGYVLFLAALIGDKEALEFFNLDYEAARQTSPESVILVNVIESVHLGIVPNYPLTELAHAESALDSRSYQPDYELDNDLLRVRCLEIIADGGVSETIKTLVHDNIYSRL